MNNKGQTLVLFISLIPFIFILLVFVLDLSYVSSEKTKLDNIATSSLKSLIKNKDINQVKNTINKNDTSIKIEKINKNSICLTKKVEPIFGNVIGYNKYNIKSCFDKKISNNKVIIEKKGK